MGLEELNYDHRDHQSAEADRNLAVKFYFDAVHNQEKSETEGRAIFDQVVFIEKRVRGDRLNVVQRPMRDGEDRQFREAYRAFQNAEESVATGTPLKEWPSMTKALLEELKYLGFHTVEQLAEASDSVCSKFAGLQTYKQKAANFVRFAKEAAPIAALEKVAEDARNEKEVLSRQVQELAAANARMEAQIEALQGKQKGK
jgi:hypothetical protein